MASKFETINTRPFILKKDNYPVWRIRIECALKSRSLWVVASRFLNIPDIYTEEQAVEEPNTSGGSSSELKIPAPIPNADQELAEKNAMAIELIQSTLEPRDIISTGMCTTAFEVLNQLKATYQGLSLNAQANAQEVFYSIKCSPRESIHEYVTRFELALNTLLMSGLDISETSKIHMLTRSLPEVYKNHARVWTRTKSPDDDIDDLFGYIKNIALEEDMSKKEEDFAMMSYNKNNARSNTNRTKHDVTGRKKFCTYCKMNNHVWQECKKRLAKKHEKENQNSGNNSNKKSKDPECSSVKLDIVCMATDLSEAVDTSLWIVDTGASAHATPNLHLIDVNSHEPSFIGLGDGHQVRVDARGVFKFEGGELNDVRVVPNLKYNLFSPLAIMKYGLVTTTKNDVCIISREDD